MDDARPSVDSGGSDGTTISVFLQEGHKKQFRAHLLKAGQGIGQSTDQAIPVFFSPNTRTRNLEQTIRAIVPADLYGDTSVASYRIAFLAKVKVVDFVVRVRRRWEIRGRWE